MKVFLYFLFSIIVLINLIAAYIYIDDYFINPGFKSISRKDICLLLLIDAMAASALLFLYRRINKKSR